VDDFDVVARATFDRAGVAVSPEDLALVHLVHDAMFSALATLDGADPSRLPFEPVDPSCAPGPP
jgi:hypothetical protein